MHLAHKPSDEMDILISAINEADLGWKADVCKYTKTHKNYGSHCEKDEALRLAQTKGSNEDDIGGDEIALEESESSKKPFGVEGDKEFEKTL